MIAEAPTGSFALPGQNYYFGAVSGGTVRSELVVSNDEVPHLQEPQVIRTVDGAKWLYSSKDLTLSLARSKLDDFDLEVLSLNEVESNNDVILGAETATQAVVKKIQSTFGLNKSELAGVCNSTRMTVDSWLNGTTPNKTKRQRLLDLIDIADAWIIGNYRINDDLLKVQQFRGQSLLDMLSSERLDRDKVLFFGTSLTIDYLDEESELEDPFA